MPKSEWFKKSILNIRWYPNLGQFNVAWLVSNPDPLKLGQENFSLVYHGRSIIYKTNKTLTRTRPTICQPGLIEHVLDKLSFEIGHKLAYAEYKWTVNQVDQRYGMRRWNDRRTMRHPVSNCDYRAWRLNSRTQQTDVIHKVKTMSVLLDIVYENFLSLTR